MPGRAVPILCPEGLGWGGTLPGAHLAGECHPFALWDVPRSAWALIMRSNRAPKCFSLSASGLPARCRVLVTSSPTERDSDSSVRS